LFGIPNLAPELVKNFFVRHTERQAHAEETVATKLGEKLNALRKRMGLSLDQLAERAGVSKSYLWELENRDAPKPSAEKLTKVAEQLSVTTDYLLDDGASLDERVVKEAFFRKFNKLDVEDQKKIEEIVDLWRKKK
jgi:transcriptional regulator with XRE-family HTH domain